MKTVEMKELTLENFQIYGTFTNLINPSWPKIGEEPVEFFRDMAQLHLGGSPASFSVTRVTKRPAVISVIEMHRHTEEGMVALDGDVLIHVAPATPNGELPLDQMEVFRVPKGTFVTLHPGVWHHAAFAAGSDCINTLIVLPERTYADDCFVYTIPEEDRIAIRAAD